MRIGVTRRVDATDRRGVRLGHRCTSSHLLQHRRRRGPRGSTPSVRRTSKTPREHIGPPVVSGAVPPVLRMSTLFVRTLREDPADAEVASHRLLVRAGYIRRAAPGGFTFLPARVDRAAQRRAHRPRGDGSPPGSRRSTSRRCCPASRTRSPAGGPSTATACSGSRTAAAPTSCSPRRTRRCSRCSSRTCTASYKDLPLSIFQIQTKFRDEARPRAGLLRGREFVMKDSYSFDLDLDGFMASVPGPPRRLRADVRAAGPAVRDRLGDVRGDGRLGQRGVPRAAGGRRGHLRALHELRLRGEHRGGAGARSPGRSPSTTRRRPRGRRHAGHADDPDARRPAQRPRRPGAAAIGRGRRPTR